MKKIAIIGLVVVFILTLTIISFAGDRYGGHRGGHSNNGNNVAGAIALGGLAGLIIGGFLSILSKPQPADSPPPPPQADYQQQSSPWQGARIALNDRSGWGDDSYAKGIIIDAFRGWGAEVIISNGSQSDAPYTLDIQTRSDGYNALVEIWLLEKATGTVRLHGLGAAEFYYDGSDRWRSYQWAASRAITNLQ